MTDAENDIVDSRLSALHIIDRRTVQTSQENGRVPGESLTSQSESSAEGQRAPDTPFGGCISDLELLTALPATNCNTSRGSETELIRIGNL